MEVILLEKVRNLGDLGDQVNVRPGYGRNYLIPTGRAVRATAENKAVFDAQRADLEKAQIAALEAAKKRVESMRDAQITIFCRAGEEGRLFGSVGTSDIAEAMAVAGMELAKSEIQLPLGPLKDIGEHEVVVSLHPEVEFRIHVTIVAEA